MSLDELYKEIILEHYQRPRNRGRLEEPTIATRGHNPLCGDEVELSLLIGDDRIERAAFTGRGCSISQASASMLTEVVTGQPLAAARATASAFRAMMTGDGPPPAANEELAALQGVKRYPVRVKCALLPWTALEEALALYEKRA